MTLAPLKKTRLSSRKLAPVTAFIVMSVCLLSAGAAHGTSSPTPDDPLKPGTTNATIDMMPLESGQLTPRAHTLNDAIERWRDQHPDLISEHVISTADLTIEVRVVGKDLPVEQRASLEALVRDTDQDARVAYRIVDVSAAALDSLLLQVRNDLDGLREKVGAVAANRNHDEPARTRVVVATDGSVALATANDILQKTYGNHVTAELNSYRTNSRNHDSTPFYAGIPLYLSSGGLNCTSGPLVQKSGFGNYMLTAGHCVGTNTGVTLYHYTASSPTTRTAIGYSSAVNASVDAALITGQYATRTWLGSPTSTTSHLTDRRVVWEAVGHTVCVGGAASGQSCTAQITDLDFTTPAGVHTVVACSSTEDPSEPGDSGASVYHVESSDLLYVHGIDNGDFGTGNGCFAYVPMYRLENALGIQLVLSGR